ncbi:sensor histidine kinase [Konateibacter massiliensis]|uniref:sensor histidine kinase n=1 Tax=Konateibacter massiliensis TaxID=2002841 RepID=UPI000C155A81|nr:histidine kinase [Konateibacter massiliensis]
MKKSLSSRWDALKLNVKFTIVILVFVIVPIVVIGGVLFMNMEKNVINESVNYMQYTMERNQDSIQNNIDSVNMTTQFFLSDTALLDVLNRSVTGEGMTTEELMEFYNTDIASLERLVNNNPLLYGVRVYATNDKVQEMMPILYRNSRMQKLSWAQKKDSFGWHYNYRDVIFDSLEQDTSRKIVSLVTPIIDYQNGKIGTIEAAMTMKNMFPSLYEEIDNEWSCFVTENRSIYFGDNEQTNSRNLILAELGDDIQKDKITTYYKQNGSEHLVISYMYIKELSGRLFSVQDITENVSRVDHTRNQFVAGMFLIAIVLTFVINLIVKHLLGQFYDILKSIRKVQKGNLEVVIENCGSDEVGELGTQINKMLERIRQLMDDNIKREVLTKNSEIRALQNQINAHFIYNVLETIKMMAEIDEEYAISDAITSLGKLLRYSMKWASGNVLVEEELEYIRNYLALINLRFDYEIYLSLNIPELVRKQEIPKMSLQPIVENAIYHGIEQMAEDTNIYIKGFLDGDDCVIEIMDAGKGMTEEAVKRLRSKIAGKIETSGGSGNGIGLKNVQDRLHMSFGEGYGIGIASMLGCYTKIMVRIPVTRNMEGEKQQPE